MKFLIVLSVAVACVYADVAHLDFNAETLRTAYDSSPEGNYKYGYETSNGIAAQAEGLVKNINSEYPALAIAGGYKYTSPEGVPVEISYVADEEGFKPVGSIIPTPHPIPEAIARGLAYIAAHPPAPETLKPTYQG